MKNCPEPIRQNDELYCSTCSLRWSADEDKPACAAETISVTKRFLLFPEYVRSSSDGQRHFVSASDLVKLYGVDERECVVWTPHLHERIKRDLISLGVMEDGTRYEGAIERRKRADFELYVRARKLFVFHDSGASPKPREMQKAFAKSNKAVMTRLEKTWPDFPAAYDVVTK